MEEQATKIQALIRGSLTRKRLKRDPQFSKMYKLSHRSQAGLYDGVSLDDYGQDDLVLFSHRRYQERKKMRESARTGEEHLERLVSLQSEEEISRTEGREKSQVLTDNLASLSASSEEDVKEISGEEGASPKGKGEEEEKLKETNDPLLLEYAEADMREAQGSEEPHTAEIDGRASGQEERKEVASEENAQRPEAEAKAETAESDPSVVPVKDWEVGGENVPPQGLIPAVESEAQSLPEKIRPEDRLEAVPSAEPSVHPDGTAPAEEEQEAVTPEAQKAELPESKQSQEALNPIKEDLIIPETDHSQATFQGSPQEPFATEALGLGNSLVLDTAAPPELSRIPSQQDQFPKREADTEQAKSGEDLEKTSEPQREIEYPQIQQDGQETPKPDASGGIPLQGEDPPTAVQASPIDLPETQHIEGEIPQEQSSEVIALPEDHARDQFQRIDAALGTPEPVQMPPMPPDQTEQPIIIVRDAETPEPEEAIFTSGMALRIPDMAETESEEPQLPIIPETKVEQEIIPIQAENASLVSPSSPTTQDLPREHTPLHILPEIPSTEGFMQVGEMPPTPVELVEERKEEQESSPQILEVKTDNQELLSVPNPSSPKSEKHEKAMSIEVLIPSLSKDYSEESPETISEMLHKALPAVPMADSTPSPKMANFTAESAKVPLISPLEEPTVQAPILADSNPNPLPESGPNSLDLPRPVEVTSSSQEQLLIPEIRETIVPPDFPQQTSAEHPEHASAKTDQPTFRVANPSGQRPSLKQPPAVYEKSSEVLLSPQTIESIQPSYRTPSFPESLKTSFRENEGRSQTDSPGRPAVSESSSKPTISEFISMPEVPESPKRPAVPEEPIQAEEPEEAPAPERASLSQVSADSNEELKTESPNHTNVIAINIPEPAAVSMFEAPRSDSPDSPSNNSSNSSLSSQEDLDADASLLLPELPRLGASSSAAILEDVLADRRQQTRPPRHLQTRPVPAPLPSRKGNKSHSQENSLSITTGSEEQLRPKKGLKSSSLLRHPPLYAKRPSGHLLHSSDPQKKAKVPRAKTTELLPPTKKKPSPYDFQWSKKMLEKVFKVGVEVKLRPAIYLPDMKVRKLRKSVVRVLGRGVDLPEIRSRSEKEKQEREFVSRVKDRV